MNQRDAAVLFFLVLTKMSWRSPLTSQYSRDAAVMPTLSGLGVGRAFSLVANWRRLRTLKQSLQRRKPHRRMSHQNRYPPAN